MGQTTTIPIKKETRERLKTFGRKDETYDEIIRRLIKEAAYSHFMEENYRLLSEKDKFVPLRKE